MKECYNFLAMKKYPTQITNCKISNNVIVLKRISNTTWTVENMSGTRIGSITKEYGWEFISYNEIGNKFDTWLHNKYPFGNCVLNFMEDFWC